VWTAGSAAAAKQPKLSLHFSEHEDDYSLTKKTQYLYKLLVAEYKVPCVSALEARSTVHVVGEDR